MMLEVVHRHEKLAPESAGVEFMAPISAAAGFWGVCQGPNVCDSGSSRIEANNWRSAITTLIITMYVPSSLWSEFKQKFNISIDLFTLLYIYKWRSL